MTPTEKLERIKLKCEQLLAIAEKRTNGEWKIGTDGGFNANKITAKTTGICEVYGIFLHTEVADAMSDKRCANGISNAAFIAACAGPAEAGWRATIAAIDDSIRQPVPEGWCHPDNPVFCENTPLINNILSAWPEELL